MASLASGPWLPERLLENGGEKILAAPEFYFELEMKQLSTHYPPESPLPAQPAEPPAAEQGKEFDLYKKGAESFHAKDFTTARATWQALLALPAQERHYRSASAAYMLGRMNIDRPMDAPDAQSNETKPSATVSADPPKIAEDQAPDDEAARYFRQVRELVKNGFAGAPLVEASLGWEAYIELHRGALDKAATLYLQQLTFQQLAAEKLSAVDSLKAVACKTTEEQAASNAVLRRIKTAEILCYDTPTVSGYPKENEGELSQGLKWLAAVEKANVERVEEAERLAWLAYSMGKFEEAERWLRRADPETGLALWLRAKLAMRAGKVEAATALMSQAIQKIPTNDAIQKAEDAYYYGHEMPSKVAAGDLGLLRLARSDFLSAFHAFLQGNHWEDAAFVAERILTLSELRQMADKEFPAKAEDDQPSAKGEEKYWYDRAFTFDHRIPLRWLLGRRLVRCGQFAEARPYLPLQYRETLDRYADALKRAEMKKAKPENRAQALFDAALIARRNGMELMGTEVEPDSALSDGMFSAADVREERLKAEYAKRSYYPTSSIEIKKVVIPVTEPERKRLVSNKVEPEKRFHYRYTAADLAWRAAKLLPDNDERTADVLNTAGNWLKNRDDAAADRFLQAIERRCPNTEVGKEVLRTHWFVDRKGPWSSAAGPSSP